ncbi:hypothetical protein [Chelatococcus reniformis]|uniref:Uncharacterized protein n=1 Tax=Chelatococcus reniformis TaxID=1494448 RepID=A0A916UCJ5_9HYPH|nr:hypothetical protein [Chelatococcus reniformis]GGC67387.1 hypothetical protein GCM10010994_27480 [Chelatococcus reniformis]
MGTQSDLPRHRSASLFAAAPTRGRPADELARQCERIAGLCDEALRAAEHGEAAAGKLIRRIEQALRALNTTAMEGVAHADVGPAAQEQRRAGGETVRRLALALHHDFWWIDLPARLNDLLATEFADAEGLMLELGRDRAGLDHVREAARQREQEADRLLPYGADLGSPFPGRVDISRAGLRWPHHHLPLERITRLSWGSRSNRLGGMPIGRVWTISVGDDQQCHVIQGGDRVVYASMVDRLWRTVGIRLYTRMLLRLRRGHVLALPGLNVSDDGVEVLRRQWFGERTERLGWDQVHVASTDEELLIQSKSDRRAYAALSYEKHDNVTILENMIWKLKDSGKSKPSELLG